MKTRLILVLIITFPIFGFTQAFRLENTDVNKLNVELAKFNYSKDVVYLYLNLNYKVQSEKLEIKTHEFKEYGECAFTQNFEHGIVYSEKQCREAAGKSINLSLPKTDRENLIKWIEVIYKTDPMDIEHGWNSEKSIFKPTDNGAGCYFEIIEETNRTNIKMYCGC